MSNKEVIRKEDELESLLNCCLVEWITNFGLLAHLVEMDKKYKRGVYEVNQTKGSNNNNQQGGTTRRRQK